MQYREVGTKVKSSCPFMLDKYFKSSVLNIGIKFLINLPIQIRKLENNLHFRSNLRFFLIHHTFYTVAEHKVLVCLMSN
jgi:hypothetical protein